VTRKAEGCGTAFAILRHLLDQAEERRDWYRGEAVSVMVEQVVAG
jgi:hypothetical protein